MSTEPAGTGDAGDDAPDRPRFKGCVFCYSAEWAAYGIRTLRRRGAVE